MIEDRGIRWAFAAACLLLVVMWTVLVASNECEGRGGVLVVGLDHTVRCAERLAVARDAGHP